MRIEILDGATVINIIEATPEFAEAVYPGAWRLADAQDPLPPEPPRVITPYALKARMTSAERIGIRTVAKSAPEVEDFQDMLDSARIIDLDDPALAGGLAALEVAGLLGAGRADAILTAQVDDKERP